MRRPNSCNARMGRNCNSLSGGRGALSARRKHRISIQFSTARTDVPRRKPRSRFPVRDFARFIDTFARPSFFREIRPWFLSARSRWLYFPFSDDDTAGSPYSVRESPLSGPFELAEVFCHGEERAFISIQSRLEEFPLPRKLIRIVLLRPVLPKKNVSSANDLRDSR